MNNSFVDVISIFKSKLENNANLQSFCQTKWGKVPAVKIVFKHRREISFQDMPLILVTRPQVGDRRIVRGGQEARHRLRLYCGFYQDDPEKALTEQIGFEEAVDDAVTLNNPFSGIALEAAVKDSVNDEGSYHPSYFTVMDVEILCQRRRS